MGLFIAIDAGLASDSATTDLITIAGMDTGYGEVSVSNTRTQVTYARTLNGVCQLRLDDLVNNTAATATPSAATWASPPDIIIFPGDSSFVLADGTPITAVIGIALPVGNPLNPTASDVATIYDTSSCGGAGVWADKQGGGTVCTPSSVILYHELAHCFHYVTGTRAATSAQEEENAEIDENDLRDQLNIPDRDVTSHNGGCGCSGSGGGCCIIASISSESIYSDEVHHLRAIRDKMLRKSEAGSDFFDRFFYSYYGFSPEVCTVMANNPELTALIKTFFVVPVIHSLELIVHYTDAKGNALTDFLAQQFEKKEFAQQYDLAMLTQLEYCLSYICQSASDIDISSTLSWINVRNAEALLNYLKSAVDDEIIKWSLLETIHIWVKAAIKLLSGVPEDEIETFLYDAISGWIAEFPVSNIWGRFSRIETEMELNYLGYYIFDKKSRTYFAQKIMNDYPGYTQTISSWALN